jgi:hypothetical protein
MDEGLRHPASRVRIERTGLARRWVQAAVFTMVACCPGSIGVTALLRAVGLRWLGPWFTLGSLGLSVALWLAALVALVASKHAVGVAIEDGDLVVGEGTSRRRVPSSALDRGVFLADRGAIVLTQRDGDRVTFTLPDDPGADATPEPWLAGLGLSAGRRPRIRTTVRSIVAQVAVLALGAPLVTSFAAGLGLLLESVLRREGISMWLTLASFVMVLWYARWGLGSEVTVGVDGVLLRQGRREDFFSYRELSVVEWTPADGLTLERVDGLKRVVRGDLGLSLEELRAHIEQARRQARAKPSQGSIDALARAGRTLPEWRRALGALLGAGPGGYRDDRVTSQGLERLVEDPEASPEQRIAAALALSESGDPEAPTRVRVVAERQAEPRVREALEKASRGALDERGFHDAVRARARGRS